VENLLGEAKIAATRYLFGRRAEEGGVCRLVDTVPSFKSFRAILDRAFFFSLDCSFVRFLQHAFREVLQD